MTDNKYFQSFNTMRKLSYQHGWMLPSEFLPTPTAYQQWLAFQHKRLQASQIRSGTIKSYQTAIRHFVEASGQDWSPYNQVGRQLSRSISTHTNLTPSVQDYPVSIEDLILITTSNFYGDLTSLACITLATFLFYSLGRISELLHAPHHAPLVMDSLVREIDSKSYSSTYKILLRQPKIKRTSDQWLMPVKPLIPCTGTNRLMTAYLAERAKLTESNVLWRKTDGLPLTAREFKTFLRTRFNLNIGECSFRAGGSTYLAGAGADHGDLQVIGRWTTDAYQKYLRDHPSTVNAHLETNVQTRALLMRLLAHSNLPTHVQPDPYWWTREPQ